MNNQNMFHLLSQVLTSSGGKADINSLAGLIALVNLFGIINYMNGDKSGGGIPLPTASAPAAAPNNDMLMSLMSMLGNSKGLPANNNQGGGGEDTGGLNPQMMFMLLNLLNSMNQNSNQNPHRERSERSSESES